MDVGAESSTDSDSGYAARQSAYQALTPARAAARRDAAALLISRVREAQLRAAVMQWLLATTRVKREPGDDACWWAPQCGQSEHCAARASAEQAEVSRRASTSVAE